MTTARIVFGFSLFVPATPALSRAQSGRTDGSSPAKHESGFGIATTGLITGEVTARGRNGETLKAANVLVQLWTTDEATTAARDAACAAWASDKSVWTQAKLEIGSPSGMDLTGTPVAKDVEVLRALMALRRDTVVTDGDGKFEFRKIPFGAYTVEAESYANNMFVQWSKDVAVIPELPASANLDASTLAENQYCTVASPDSAIRSDSAKV